MTQLLVFTKNIFVQHTVAALSGNKNVLFFNNRLKFLVCSTIIENAIILIDTLDPDGQDVRWLYEKLKSRGLARGVKYIVPQIVTDNRYLRGFTLITNVAMLRKVWPATREVLHTNQDLSAGGLVRFNVQKKLSDGEMFFLNNLYDVESKKFEKRTKNDASRLYYIRCKLYLGNSTELKQLILLLKENEDLKKTKTNDTIFDMSKIIKPLNPYDQLTG